MYQALFRALEPNVQSSWPHGAYVVGSGMGSKRYFYFQGQNFKLSLLKSPICPTKCAKNFSTFSSHRLPLWSPSAGGGFSVFDSSFPSCNIQPSNPFISAEHLGDRSLTNVRKSRSMLSSFLIFITIIIIVTSVSHIHSEKFRYNREKR